MSLAFAGSFPPARDALSEHIRSSILGPWVLSRWCVTYDDGSVKYPYGPKARGMLIYTADSHMAVQLANPDVDVDEASKVEEGYFAYFGTYAVDAEAGTITHSLQGSLSPSWVGTEQVRAYELTETNHLNLTAVVPTDDVLAASIGAKGSNHLEWIRPD